MVRMSELWHSLLSEIDVPKKQVRLVIHAHGKISNSCDPDEEPAYMPERVIDDAGHLPLAHF